MNLQIYAIFDEQSLRDNATLVIEVCESGIHGVRMEGSLAVARMFQYSCGDIWISEDVEEAAAETADGVFQLEDGGCEDCRWCSEGR